MLSSVQHGFGYRLHFHPKAPMMHSSPPPHAGCGSAAHVTINRILETRLTYSLASVCFSRTRHDDRQHGAVRRALLLDVVHDVLEHKQARRHKKKKSGEYHEISRRGVIT